MAVYTNNVTAKIVELFEETLDQYDITVPSPDDDDRDMKTSARLYGSTYGDLFNAVRDELIDALIELQCDPTHEIIVGWE